MRKLITILIVAIAALSFAVIASAATVKPGDKAECKDAKSITLVAQGNSSKGDRSNANAVVWKSANATTVSIALGPGEHNGLAGGRGVGMADKHSMGHKKVVLTGQTNFSRGDSLGDISGLVRITNTGTVPISVSCG
ncbi:MAG: hypothetical protein ACE5ER_05125 [Nitrospinaceae bacterium]